MDAPQNTQIPSLSNSTLAMLATPLSKSCTAGLAHHREDVVLPALGTSTKIKKYRRLLYETSYAWAELMGQSFTPKTKKNSDTPTLPDRLNPVADMLVGRLH